MESTKSPTSIPLGLLAGKVAAITGGLAGIGRAIALEFLAEGAHVVINHVSAERDVARVSAFHAERPKNGTECIFVAGDVSDSSTGQAIVDTAVEYFHRLDIFVSNAGICQFAEFLTMPLNVYERTIRINMDGAFYATQAAAKQMATQDPPGGSIIAISSISALVGGGLQTHYTPTKAGVLSLMQSCAVALGKYNIRCNALLPGTIETKLNLEDLKDEEKRKYTEGRIPLGRTGVPKDCAGPAVFLASDRLSGYVCDETKPQCTRCQKAGVDCPGYRNIDHLIFRDENAAAKLSALQPRPRKHQVTTVDLNVSTTASSLVEEQLDPQIVTRGLFLPPPVLPPSLAEHESICLFFSTFILPTNPEVQYPGFLAFLPDLYQSSSEQHPCFRMALSSVGMACNAHRLSSSTLAMDARITFGKSLGLLRNAIQNPERPCHDATMMTIWLLGLYEAMSEGPLEPWGSHIQVISYLLKLRGGQQLDTKWGRDVFRTLFGHLKLRSLIFSEQLTLNPREWTDKTTGPLPNQRLGAGLFRISEIRARIKQFNSSVEQNRAREIEFLSSIQDEAFMVDIAMSHWRDSASPQWDYETIGGVDGGGSSHSLGFHHVYTDVHIASLWNFYRASRILLHESFDGVDGISATHVINNHHGPVPVPDSGAIFPCRKLVGQLADEILASVPFSLGDIDNVGRTSRPTGSGRLGAFFLTWPLFVIHTATQVSRDKKLLAQEILRRIGLEFGFRQAFLLSQNTHRTSNG
ncbi:MAG: hypothetical protein M1834_004819 [Cirrosporium novae-zelandiae]|nr:MAG: hypothetical protein M1834_004819 [Cirrosporium novae-zelandiae]